MPASWKTEDSHLKAHLNISVQAEVFISRERDKEGKQIKGRDCRPAGRGLAGTNMDL